MAKNIRVRVRRRVDPFTVVPLPWPEGTGWPNGSAIFRAGVLHGKECGVAWDIRDTEEKPGFLGRVVRENRQRHHAWKWIKLHKRYTYRGVFDEHWKAVHAI